MAKKTGIPSSASGRTHPFNGTIYYLGAFDLSGGNASTQRVRQNAKIFRDLGYRVIIVGIHKRGSRGVERRGSFTVDGFQSLSINVGEGGLWAAYRRLIPAAIARMLSGPFGASGVICYNYLAIPQFQIQLLCRRNGVAFAADATEWYGPDGGLAASLRRKVDTSTRVRLLNRLADGIITTSPYLTKFYRPRGRPLVELPTLIDRRDTGVGEPRRDGTLRLVFFGNPFNTNLKNPRPRQMKERLDTIVEIVSIVNSRETVATLDIYGVSAEQYANAFRCGAEEIAFDWLNFFGQVPRAVVFEETKSADFSIYFRESTRANIAGFPSKFAESVTCGTPVITNYMENISAFAKDGFNCLLVDPSNKEQAAESIRAISRRRQDITRMQMFCGDSAPFDYRNWIDPVERFLQTWMPEREAA